ncbi:unnamed protein product [[Candida] boidinii]|uniref:Unnamed protein product n=1 Tax=Candida boidinii TaxID=5477 RepID=A0ACB5TSL4_CANBO|nr:unnamed protein product [[Candida] boidinii]
MSDTVEFETIFKQIFDLKIPGVSGSRIRKLTVLADENVKEESKLIPKLLDLYKITPNTHKLGGLYIVDSIARSYKEKAIKDDVEINDESPEGTYASGFLKIQKNAIQLIDEIIPNANEDIKEKVGKLIDIWGKAKTFDSSIIDSIRSKYFATTTPPGTPPVKSSSNNTSNNNTSTSATASAQIAPSSSSCSTNGANSSSAVSANDPTSVLQALANLANKAPTPTPPKNFSALASDSSSSNNNNGMPFDNNNNQQQPLANSSDPNAIFQLLQNMGNKPNNNNNNMNMNNGNNDMNNGNNFRDNNNNGGRFGGYRERESRGQNPGNPYTNRRQRSRSPPNRRGGHQQHDNNMGDDGEHPPLTHVEGERNVPGTPHYREKKPFFDNTIAPGCIKVASRTIFIGGVPYHMDERALASQLRPYAEVQSVILNNERKHAFVKVYSRSEAEQTVKAFSQNHPSGLRSRWGVGFGPRDCCDYSTGISTIPISRLTDADKRWIVAAEWGGTAGLPLQPGLFIEEPDIEIGHGVSSKATSKKMPTNSAPNGPKSDGFGNHGNGNGGGRHNNHHNGNNNYNSNNSPMNPGHIPLNFGNMGGPGPNNNNNNNGNGNGNGSPPVDPNNMAQIAAMMSAMTNMQNQGGNNNGGQMDMASMFQNLANMMNQQQRK